MKGKILKTLTSTGILTAGLVLAGCAGDQSEEVTETLVDGDEIELTYVNWDTELASTHVVGQVLEDVGYDVTLTSVESPIMWQSIASGESDAMVAGWLPYTHAGEFEQYGDDIVSLGVNYEDALIGLVVPEYMEGLDSIEDLEDQIEDKTIVGIERGAGTVEAAERALEDYGKEDWEVIASSSGAMVTELRQAINNEEDIIVTGWTPHWKFIEFDLKMLDDPKNSFGESEYIETFAREGFTEDHPVAATILGNFYWEQEEFESVMLDINEGVEEDQAAKNFIQDNPELVESWLEGAEEAAETGQAVGVSEEKDQGSQGQGDLPTPGEDGEEGDQEDDPEADQDGEEADDQEAA